MLAYDGAALTLILTIEVRALLTLLPPLSLFSPLPSILLADEVFCPPKPQVMSPANAVKSRLQMILVSDRTGLDLPTLVQIKQNSMAALAADQVRGGEGMWGEVDPLLFQRLMKLRLPRKTLLLRATSS